MKKLIIPLFIAISVSGIIYYSFAEKENLQSMEMQELRADVYPLSDGLARGYVTFTQKKEGVLVEAEFSGLSEGKHGFHIHEFGNCSATDGTSAGGHYNPFGNRHSSRDSEDRHMGDMGNLIGDKDGVASLSYLDTTIELSKITGRGIVIHAGEDDLNSQPSGAAGPRIACGVIGISK